MILNTKIKYAGAVLIVVLAAVMFFVSYDSGGNNLVTVKYRDDQVDISKPWFDPLDTSSSSVVGGAWYDNDNEYMIIKLDEVYYHYCGLPSEIWENFRTVSSYGTYYNSYIKGSYDCRLNYVPSYNENTANELDETCVTQAGGIADNRLLEFGYTLDEDEGWIDSEGNNPSYELSNEIEDLFNKEYQDCLELKPNE